MITNKVQKMKDLSKTWVLTRKQFEDFRRKKNRNIILDLSINTSGTHGPKIQILKLAFVDSKN